MTLMAVFQGKKCALLASDTMVRFADESQMNLALSERKYNTFISEKFRMLPNGDYFGFNGNLKTEEYSVIASKSLEELLILPLASDPLIRTNRSLTLFYASVSAAQVYAADFTQPLSAAERGQLFVSGGEATHSQDIADLTGKFRRGKKFDKDFLRELSAQYEKYFLGAEKTTDCFGGYASYIVSPGKIRMLTKRLGKLNGCPEAQMDLDGSFFY